MLTRCSTLSPIAAVGHNCGLHRNFVDEQMEQDGEVCIHPPLQRLCTVSIALLPLILVHCSERTCIRLPDTGSEQLRTRVLRLTSWTMPRKEHSTTVFDAWCGEKVTHRAELCCLHSRFFFCSTCQSCRQSPSEYSRTPHRNTRVTRVSHPRCSTTLHKDTRVTRAQPPAMFHNVPQRHPRNTSPSMAL